MVTNVQTELTGLLDAFAIVDGKVNQLEDDVSSIYSTLDTKVSGIKNQRIDTQLDIAAYTTNNGFDFALPTDSMQALDVKVNGQVFPVGTGEAFNISGSTAGNGKYNSGDKLALDGTKLGFTLESTDRIYVTLVSTI